MAVSPKLLFLLSWGMLNFFWLMVSRALSLAMIVLLVLLVLMSRLKHDILLITVHFVDTDTIAFPARPLRRPAAGALDRRQPHAAADGLVLARRSLSCPRADRGGWRLLGFAAVTAISFVNPLANHEAFSGDSYVSKFALRVSVSELVTHGLLESDPIAHGALGPAATRACHTPPSVRTSSWCSTSSFEIWRRRACAWRRLS